MCASPLDRFQARLIDRHLGLWLAAAAFLLIAGWLLPAMTLRQLLIFSDEVSILGAIWRLFAEGEYGLFVLVFAFTVIFPAAKLTVAGLAWRRRGTDETARRWLAWAERFGHWSMLDVFVIALFVVVVKLSAVSDVTIHAGLYVFALAALLSIVVVRRVAAADDT